MCRECETRVRSTAGESSNFRVDVGLHAFETLVYSLSRWKYVKQFCAYYFAYITMLYLNICTYGLWPEIKFYYYPYY